MNSWLLSMRWPERIARERPMLTASVKASIVLARATGATFLKVSNDRSGKDNGGSWEGSAPTVLMEVTAAPKYPFSARAKRLPKMVALII